jgi:two-component system CheB/CheR fusion protein
VGGLTIAQQEDQAEHSGMPASAIASGYVDVVTEAEKMHEHIYEFLHHPYASREKETLSAGEANLNVPKILNLIRTRTGNDFSKYKQSTTRRRIERRMAVHRIERIGDYLQYLHKNSTEIEALFKDLLIGVTNFFRDPHAFELLAEKAIAKIIKDKASDLPVRVWVPACATGEEAYSIAILLAEEMAKQNKHLSVQIFGTDIDPDAIHFAREGAYPENIVADVPKERLSRYFTREGKIFRISKQIREMIVFSVQNVIKDPPFSRLDLLSCRNLLIYLEPELQRKLLPLFHYTLNDSGFLFLGPSETASAFTDLFNTVDSKWKLFTCRDNGVKHIEALPPFGDTKGGKTFPKPYAMTDIRNIAQRIVLDDYAPPSVIVDEKFDIIYYQGQTQKYLQMPVGEPSHNLMKLVRRELHHKLVASLSGAQRQKKAIVSPGVRFKEGDAFHSVDIIVRPLPESAPKEAMIVLFMERLPVETKDFKKEEQQPGATQDPKYHHLEQELAYTRETLQTTIEELETSNEELKSTNEELQSTNEELQSTNEELETSKEEMHSTNEELTTVNHELQRKVTELEHVNNDISNLLAATNIGTLFLDGELRIKRFTPAVTSYFNLIDSDIGRPIKDITSRSTYSSIEADAREVLRNLIPKELELGCDDGRSLAIRIMPYRTLNNVIDGVVITFVQSMERH